MKRNSHHVMINLDGGWSVKADGVVRSARRFKTEAEAVAYARDLATMKSGDVYFHRPDGSVRDKASY